MTGAPTYGPSTVHKFDIAISDSPTTIPIAQSARIVHLAAQDDRAPTIQLWALVQVDEQGRPIGVDKGRRFEVYGTGHPVPGKRKHTGTIISGGLVWHVFEAIPPH